MRTNGIRRRRASFGRKWRGTLLALLVLLFGLAPAVNAACSLDALGAHYSGAGSHTPVAPDTPVPGDDLCCAHDLDAFVVKAKATTADGAWALAPSGVFLAASSRSILEPVAGPAGRLQPLAPPEPSFRRFPRLLL